jgi:hypothetical protein
MTDPDEVRVTAHEVERQLGLDGGVFRVPDEFDAPLPSGVADRLFVP